MFNFNNLFSIIAVLFCIFFSSCSKDSLDYDVAVEDIPVAFGYNSHRPAVVTFIHSDGSRESVNMTGVGRRWEGSCIAIEVSMDKNWKSVTHPSNSFSWSWTECIYFKDNEGNVDNHNGQFLYNTGQSNLGYSFTIKVPTFPHYFNDDAVYVTAIGLFEHNN